MKTSDESVTRMSRLQATAITLLRLLLAAWIGGAILYVITSIAEQTSDHFGSVARDHLATIRFPLYYKFGFVIHSLSLLIAAAGLISATRTSRKRLISTLALISISGILILLDYFFVYSPLQEMITPAGKARTAEFVQLHKWSTYANLVHLSVMLIAAIVISLPIHTARPADNDGK